MAKVAQNFMSRKSRVRNPKAQKPDGPETAPISTPRKHPAWLAPAICVALAGAVWFVFGQTLRHGFVNYDDSAYVYENPIVAKGINHNSVPWAFSHIVGGNWHPLTVLSHMLDCQWNGLQPGGHHLTNVLLHAAATVFLFLLLRNLTGALWPSALAAAVFGVHPLRVESVAWISERKDVLSGLFFMLTLMAYAAYARRKRLGAVFYAAALCFYAMGLLSKPMLVTLPCVLLLLDYWPLKRVTREPGIWRRLVLEKLPFFAMSIIISVVTFWAQKNAKGVRSTIDVPALDRLANAAIACATYVKEMFVPVQLAVFYPLRRPVPLGSAVACGLALATFTALAFRWKARRPYLWVGWLWYLGMLAPVIGLIQVGSQSRADRYTYLPQIGLYILVAWFLADFVRSRTWARPAVALAGVAAVAGLAFAARAQASYWKDSFTLWTHALQCAPDNPVARSSMGNFFADEGKIGDAMAQYKRALELRPDHVEALNNLGAQYYKLGATATAIDYYQRALRVDPDYAEARNNLAVSLTRQGDPEGAIEQLRRALQTNPDFSDAEVNFGNALAAESKFAQAEPHFRRAVDLSPASSDGWNGLGNVLSQEKKWDESRLAYERVFQLRPGYADAHYNYAIALSDEGKLADAAEQYRQAVKINPDYARAEANWGALLARQNQWPEARRHLERAVMIDADDAEARANLAVVLGREGKIAEAGAEYQRALVVAQAQHQTALAERIRRGLQTCQAALTRSQTQ